MRQCCSQDQTSQDMIKFVIAEFQLVLSKTLQSIQAETEQDQGKMPRAETLKKRISRLVQRPGPISSSTKPQGIFLPSDAFKCMA